MGALDHSAATLRLFGDDLVPDQVSALLGVVPTEAHAKGEEITSPSTGNVRTAKTGSWRLRASRREPEDLEGQIFEILDALPSDLEVWAQLRRFEPHFFCGLFMASGNDGMSLSARALFALGQRGIGIGLDIYDSNDD
jgi:hypothetical protein